MKNLHDLIAYAFIDATFQRQNLGEESIEMNHVTWFTNVYCATIKLSLHWFKSARLTLKSFSCSVLEYK